MNCTRDSVVEIWPLLIGIDAKNASECGERSPLLGYDIVAFGRASSVHSTLSRSLSFLYVIAMLRCPPLYQAPKFRDVILSGSLFELRKQVHLDSIVRRDDRDSPCEGPRTAPSDESPSAPSRT